ncbi:uncharacterized protein LOC125886467 [Epinephelus fuscoguttatus]|uniref:uncharacterized protein LOC125886467 n=1 Tax=Epinephelus fuscoguttatus TaxID=293821 RepID=UPI0020D0C75F|nr:uncharacterized protein LOC125886467 [Epinephelus fuscoguttatus]
MSVTMGSCQGKGRLHHSQQFPTGKVPICVWKPCLMRPEQSRRSQFYQTLNLISYLTAGRCPRNHCHQILTFGSCRTGWQTLEHPPQNQWYSKVNVGPSHLTHLFLSSAPLKSVTMGSCQGKGRLHHSQHFQTGKVLICVWKVCLTKPEQSPRNQFCQTLNLINYLTAGRCPQNQWYSNVNVGPSHLTHLFLSSAPLKSVTMGSCQGTDPLHHNQHFQTGKVLICVWKVCLTKPEQSPRNQFCQTLNLINYLTAGRCPQNQWYSNVNVGPSHLTHLFLSSAPLKSVTMGSCQGTDPLHHNQHFQTGKVLICVWKVCLTKPEQSPRNQFYQTLNLISCLTAGRCPLNQCCQILTFRSCRTGWQTLEHPPQNLWHQWSST